MKTIIIFAVSIFLSLASLAEVNPLSGELTFDTVDLLTKEAVTPFKVQRQYNHKRKSFGLFGNNWCSQLEETVVRSNLGLEIRKCGQTTGAVFAKVDGGYANPAGTEVMQELPNHAGYMRVADQFVFGYNEQGQLAVIALKSQPKLPVVRIYFDKFNMIERIVHQGKKHYFITYKKGEKLIEKIEGPQKITATYSYDKHNNLVKVENAWGKKLTYAYDAQSRITEFSLPDGSSHTVSYEQKLDAVSKVIDNKNCGLEISYKMNVTNAVLNTTVKNICDKTTKEFTSASSPLFQKHRYDVSTLFRAPASISDRLAADNKNWKTIKADGVRWEYLENEFGYVSQIKRISLATNKKKTLTTKYRNERLVELEIKGEGKVVLNYTSGKLASMDAKNYAAFELFTEFLLAKNGARNE